VPPTQRWEIAVPLSSGPTAQLIELYRRYACLSIHDFWLRCFELGGMNTPWELDAFLHEASLPTDHEHNLMALALNEYFVEIGVSQAVSYIDA